MRLAMRSLAVFFFFILLTMYLAPLAFAQTTLFRSASVVTTDTLGTFYTNLENCSVTDGKTCDRELVALYGNLYFKDFGNYDDFGMPVGSIITKVKIRVTGRASIPAFALYVGLGTNCQNPSDLWSLWQLNGSIINTQTFVTDVMQSWFPKTVLASCLSSSSFENRSFTFRINHSSGQPWSANIDNFEVAFDYEVQPTPTPAPGPIPFLDLPWDYEGKGLTFNEAALSMTSYFDHSYPLLGGGLFEPNSFLNQITTFMNENSTTKSYSSHDGYDYGIKAKVKNGDPVLAAASGIASYVNSCSACGNMIVIDHGNGYQTRYLHLQAEGLITNVPGQKVNVLARQKIGQVGATGHVIPEGDKGAHIHFGVFEDKNKDGNFEDNVPDGVMDPFGWQSKEPDPWPGFVFDYGGQRKTGNRSYYLWTKKIDNLDAELTSNGGVFNTERYELNFPQDSVLDDIKLIIQSSPIVKALDNLRSIGSTLVVNAFDALGNAVTDFTKPFTITVDFSSIDLSSYNKDAIFIYSSTDGVNWIKEQTAVDLGSGTATSQLNHLTHFALMAERIDVTSPVTTATSSGQQGQPNWFRSDVSISLDGEDNEGGLGTNYTLFKKDEGDWQTYTDSLTFTTDGHHEVEFYSVDKDGNIEDVKSIEFDIDKTAPEAKIFVDQNKQDVAVEGIDENQTSIEKIENIPKKKDKAYYLITDQAGNTLKLDVKDKDEDAKHTFKIYSIQYNQYPPIAQPDNHYNVIYKGQKSKLKVLEQNLGTKINIKYDGDKDQSVVVTRANGQEKIKEIKNGLVLLQILTEKGTLEYGL